MPSTILWINTFWLLFSLCWIFYCIWFNVSKYWFVMIFCLSAFVLLGDISLFFPFNSLFFFFFFIICLMIDWFRCISFIISYFLEHNLSIIIGIYRKEMKFFPLFLLIHSNSCSWIEWAFLNTFFWFSFINVNQKKQKYMTHRKNSNIPSKSDCSITLDLFVSIEVVEVNVFVIVNKLWK